MIPVPPSSQMRPLVVVPVHRPEPTVDEAFGIQRCGQILVDHPITFILPDSLSGLAYQRLIPNARLCRVPAKWMASVKSYNRMIIRPSFYSLFKGYTHLLIHEPDALVFADQLLYWCRQSFDYIGAPWFEGFSNPASDAPVIGIGNSGFSLIRISAIQRFLLSRDRWISRKLVLWQIYCLLRGQHCRYPLSSLLRMLGSAGSVVGAHRVLEDHCDGFISEWASRIRPSLRLASVEQALHFAWEVSPRRCSELIHGQLPFGVHAWRRYDPDFILQCLAV